MMLKCDLAGAGKACLVFIIAMGAIIQGACGIDVTVSGSGADGSSSVSMNLRPSYDTSLDAQLTVDGGTVIPELRSIGPISLFEERHDVVDSTGKRASVYVKVVNAKDGLTYSSQVIPKEGWTSAQPYVSAEQWLNVPRADSIKVSASANYGNLFAYTQMQEDKGSSSADYVTLEDYHGKGYASATQVDALQTANEVSGKSIEIYGDANDGSFSKGMELWVAGSATNIKALDTSSSAGTATQAALSGHINGGFISKSGVGTQTKTRTSNYGTEYDLDMKAAKGSSPTGIVGYYVDINNPAANKIQSAVNATSNGDTVNVASGRYIENVKIDKSLSVKGYGEGSTIVDANKAGIVFTVGKANPNVDVILSGMNITGGNSANYGGGIYNLARLTVTDSTIFRNNAANGGGIFNEGTLNMIGDSISYNTANAKSVAPYSRGGGIYNAGTLTLTSNSMDHNYADEGGAIYSQGGAKMTMTSSTINDNKARFNGGGIYNDGVFTLNSGSIDHNIAMYGGGIFNFGTVTQNGGNIDFNKVVEGYDPRQPWVEGGYGGGVYNDENIGSFNLIGGSINHNSAPNDAGGVYNSGHFNLIGGSINYNNAVSGGGVLSDYESPCIFTMTGGSINYNVAKEHGAGILNYGPLILKGGSISNNQALTGYGGGIFADWGSQQVTFSGTTVKVQNNKAHIPASQTGWYKSLGVYFGNTVPTQVSGFNPSTQVTSNSRI